jgi:hypothetical protein
MNTPLKTWEVLFTNRDGDLEAEEVHAHSCNESEGSLFFKNHDRCGITRAFDNRALIECKFLGDKEPA